MRKIISLSIVVLFIPLIMLADSAKTLFEIANDHYNKGEYEQSIALYDSLISNNLESADLYYNMGNAWYKLEEMPKAIFYFEKAKKIDPNNADIAYNLELANTKIADRIEIVPEFFLKTWWKTMLDTFNEAQWMLVNIGMFLVFLLFTIYFFISKKAAIKKFSFTLALLFLLLSLVSGLIGYRSYKIKTNHNTAIIFTPTVNIKSAPDDNSSTIFILHQGTKVTLMEETTQWQKVKIANGSEGWLLKTDFEAI